MKKNNIQKDWSDILREKAGGYAPDAPQGSFDSLKEKMLAAGAAAAAGAHGAADGSVAGAVDGAADGATSGTISEAVSEVVSGTAAGAASEAVSEVASEVVSGTVTEATNVAGANGEKAVCNGAATAHGDGSQGTSVCVGAATAHGDGSQGTSVCNGASSAHEDGSQGTSVCNGAAAAHGDGSQGASVCNGASSAHGAKHLHLRRNILRGTAVAASLAAVITLGVLMLNDGKVSDREVESVTARENGAAVAESVTAQEVKSASGQTDDAAVAESVAAREVESAAESVTAWGNGAAVAESVSASETEKAVGHNALAEASSTKENAIVKSVPVKEPAVTEAVPAKEVAVAKAVPAKGSSITKADGTATRTTHEKNVSVSENALADASTVANKTETGREQSASTQSVQTKESETQDSAPQSAANQNPTPQDVASGTGSRNAASQRTVLQENIHQDAVAQRTALQENIHQDAVAQKTALQENTHQDAAAKDAAKGDATGTESAPKTATGTLQQDLFASLDETDAKPSGSIRSQLKRFSVGASGILAANSSKTGTKRTISQNGIAVTADKYGKKYYSFGAPEIHYEYSAPVSAGISLRYDITNRLYAETGLRFTYLTTRVTPSEARQDLLFAGIPVGIGCRIATFGNLDLYGSTYGMPAKCVWGREGTSFPANISGIRDIPILWSAGVAPGVQYNFGSLVGIYAEPTLSYYFKNEDAPQTLYKENPFYFTLNIGVRFNL